MVQLLGQDRGLLINLMIGQRINFKYLFPLYLSSNILTLIITISQSNESRSYAIKKKGYNITISN